MALKKPRVYLSPPLNHSSRRPYMWVFSIPRYQIQAVWRGFSTFFCQRSKRQIICQQHFWGFYICLSHLNRYFCWTTVVFIHLSMHVLAFLSTFVSAVFGAWQSHLLWILFWKTVKTCDDLPDMEDAPGFFSSFPILMHRSPPLSASWFNVFTWNYDPDFRIFIFGDRLTYGYVWKWGIPPIIAI